MGLFRAAPYAPWRPPHPRRFRALPGPKNPDDRADLSPARSALSSQPRAACRRSERREKRIAACDIEDMSKRHTPRRLVPPRVRTSIRLSLLCSARKAPCLSLWERWSSVARPERARCQQSIAHFTTPCLDGEGKPRQATSRKTPALAVLCSRAHLFPAVRRVPPHTVKERAARSLHGALFCCGKRLMPL